MVDKSRFLLAGEQSERLLFRKVDQTDFDTWMEFYHDPESVRYWNVATTDPLANCREWFEKVFYRYSNGLGGMNALINRDTGEFVGQCGLLIQTVDGLTEMEIGYSIMPNCRRYGYALEAARKCRDVAFRNQWAESLISIINVDNTPSQGVALKNGMREEKRTVYHGNNVVIYRITSTEYASLMFEA